jgi:plasmid stabilization system protein ParE
LPYRLSALAEQDLEEIWSHVAEDASPTRAVRLIDAIFDRFELLADSPGQAATGQSSAKGYVASQKPKVRRRLRTLLCIT